MAAGIATLVENQPAQREQQCIVFSKSLRTWPSVVWFARTTSEITQTRMKGQIASFNAHSSTPTAAFLPSQEETQTMVREKLGPKLRPPQTLYLLGKGELRPCLSFWRGKTQTMVWVSGVFGVGVDEGALIVEQWLFDANKAKTEMRHFCLKFFEPRCTPVKRDRELPAQKVQGMVSSRTRSERDTNLHNLRVLRDKEGQHSRID